MHSCQAGWPVVGGVWECWRHCWGTFQRCCTELEVGDRIIVAGTFSNPDIKTGTLRYLGSTDFAEGTWAGVELDAATGRNNGSVNGKRYFNCPWNDNYGMIIICSVSCGRKITKESYRHVCK